jgi:hypothetical protein
MGWLYLGQDRGMRIWFAVSRSRYECEGMGWLYLGQDIWVSVWAGCIEVRIEE